MENAFLVLDTALEAKVLANKDESKCLKPLIAVKTPKILSMKLPAGAKQSPFMLPCGVEMSEVSDLIV